MNAITQAAKLYFSGRLSEIDRFRRHPVAAQQKQLDFLLKAGRDTVYGREHGFAGIRSADDFAARVPVVDYDSLHPYIDRCRNGEGHVLWNKTIRWFAKSSGTTSDKSKYLPVSCRSLHSTHLRGPKDCAAIFLQHHPRSTAFCKKVLTLGGSFETGGTAGIRCGDLSAIMIENTPLLAQKLLRLPLKEIALTPDFDRKVELICETCTDKKIGSFAGVPSWNLVMLNRVLEYTGKNNVLEVWPGMEVFFHGGISFAPYKEQYRRLFPSDTMHYMDTYNASEGFFGIQDDPLREDMLLMLDYGVYYEFLPVEHLGDPGRAVPLEGVETGVNYALIITTDSGLWRYMIGDTVEFTSLSPCRIRITGRTKQFINAFGEEVVMDNAERAVKAASDATGAFVTDYTAGPVYMEGKQKGRHQWLIEFANPPASLETFVEVLDKTLQQHNSDYEAKRRNDFTLLAPQVTVLEKGTFIRWMRGRRKLGGQHKVPRLCNDRQYLDSILEMLRAPAG